MRLPSQVGHGRFRAGRNSSERIGKWRDPRFHGEIHPKLGGRGRPVRSARVPKVYGWLGKAQKALVFAGGVVAASTKAKPDEVRGKLGSIGPVLADTLQFISDWTWALTPTLLIAAAIISWSRKKYGDPEIWKELQKSVDSFRSEVFGKVAGSNYQHHFRVTLYQYKSWCLSKWSLSAWLVPVVRSGYFGKGNVREFQVDRNSAGNAKGVTGRAWESEGSIHIENLPNLNAPGTAQEFAEYASTTNVTLDDLKKKPSHSRAFWAVRVEAKGEPWGVLVVDCVSPNVDKRKADKAFGSYAQTFSLLLQRA